MVNLPESLCIWEGGLSVQNSLLLFSRCILRPGVSWPEGWVWVSLREGSPQDCLWVTRAVGPTPFRSLCLQNTPLNHFHQLGNSVQGPLLKGFCLWRLAGYRRTLSLNSLWDILESVSSSVSSEMHICLYTEVLVDTDAHVHIFIDDNTHTHTHTHTHVHTLEQPKPQNRQAVTAAS